MITITSQYEKEVSMEILHFREADKILKKNSLYKDVISTMEYIEDVLQGSIHRRELLRQALEDMDWRRPDDLSALRFLDAD
jgi:hypothetical protein